VGGVEVETAAAQPGQLPKAQAGAKQGEHRSHQNSGKRAKSWPASEGVSARHLAWLSTWSGSAQRLGKRDFADRVGIDGAFVDGVLEDAQQQPRFKTSQARQVHGQRKRWSAPCLEPDGRPVYRMENASPVRAAVIHRRLIAGAPGRGWRSLACSD
jgi:hypothetical protein